MKADAVKKMTGPGELIDVKQLIAESSVEELNRRAEEYFANTKDWTFHLSKPFGAIEETPQLLINFATVLQGLDLCRGISILEFGAGSCWASRFLTQLGCKVIATDISPTALRMGQELYAQNPVFGKTLDPQFLLFDGHRIDLPDESVDRIICLHALHHVPNPRTVLSEFGRILKDGGIAGFAEPGPEHSRSPQSQEEMKNFGVVENDVDMQTIWRDGKEAGFTDMKLAVFNVPRFLVSLPDFENLLHGGSTSKRFAKATEVFLKDQRTFFLYKGAPAIRDSRYPAALTARINIQPGSLAVTEGEAISLRARIENNSRSIWLPRSAGLGGVQLGCHVCNESGKVIHNSYHWEALTPGDGRPIMLDETVDIDVHLPPLSVGKYILEFDMVSNDVCWFAQSGSPTVRVPLTVHG